MPWSMKWMIAGTACETIVGPPCARGEDRFAVTSTIVGLMLERTFAGSDRVGLRANEAERVGHAGLRGEVVISLFTMPVRGVRRSRTC